MAEGLNRTAVNNSLLALKNYAVEDRGMKVSLILMLGSVVVILFQTMNLAQLPRLRVTFHTLPLFVNFTCVRAEKLRDSGNPH